jgi:hypothetical protein
MEREGNFDAVGVGLRFGVVVDVLQFRKMAVLPSDPKWGVTSAKRDR